MLAEKFGEQAHGHAAVLQHVGNTRWHAQIVFEHVIDAVALLIGRAHDVYAGDIGVDIVGHLNALHLGPVLAVAAHQLRRDQAGTHHVLAMVGIADEAVERLHALGQTGLHAGPLMGRNDAGDQIERNQAFRTCAALVLVAIDGKGDTHAAKNDFRLGTARSQIFLRLFAQPLRIVPIVVSHRTTFGGQAQIHLIECAHLVLSIFAAAHAGKPRISV